MSQDMKRLDKIEAALTPKQAVIMWIQEALKYRNLFEYASYLQSQSDTAYPLWRLPDQVEKSTRTAMKGQHRDLINAAVRRAIRDVCFLFHLCLRLNQEVMLQKRAWNLQLILLAERLIRLVDYQSAVRRERYKADCIADRVSREMPYPLNTDTADAVQAAIQHNVTTWLELEEDEIESWLYNYLVSRGAIQLPENSYEFSDGKFHPRVEPDNEKEVRDCFQDDAQFERFRSGEDYSHGLAGVTDAEYNAHYDEMVTALHSLVASGQVQGGATVYLETVPIRFLREAPLVEGKWIDRYVVELAEWGALLQDRGYAVQLHDNDHPLALAQFVLSDVAEVNQDELAKLRQKVVLNMAKFPGTIRKIDGRPYIHFEDYCNWLGRKLKDDIITEIKKGIITASWNACVNARGGEGIATLAGVPVTLLQCYIEGYSYYTCPNGAGDHLCRRKQLLDSLRTPNSWDNQQEELIQDLKDAMEGFLVEVYSFRDVITAVSQHYFDRHQLLFPDLEKVLSEIIDGAEDLVSIFNDIIDEGMEQHGEMDMEDIRRITSMRTSQKTTYLVDMAKATALGNIGEKQAARALTGRYL